MKINEKIRTLREMNNLTQEEMAGKLSMSTNGYANIERGDSKVHTEKLEKIAHVFGMQAVELMAFGEKNSVLCMVGENHSYSGVNVVIGTMDENSMVSEISKLQLTLTHKDEIINKLNEQVADLRALVAALKK